MNKTHTPNKGWEKDRVPTCASRIYDTPDVRVDTIYSEARRALIRTYAHTRRRE